MYVHVHLYRLGKLLSWIPYALMVLLSITKASPSHFLLTSNPGYLEYR